jgi:catechol 2,3-dioxygenase-like lactoylglutathione lyase family enzyme
MELGAFSVSLAVRDIAASQAFYRKLGFSPVLGDIAANWLIMRNGRTTIGLFQGMFDTNTLTFNPGWDDSASPLGEFVDVRQIQRALKAEGVALDTEADEATRGPASFAIKDPDGNPILFDQHV